MLQEGLHSIVANLMHYLSDPRGRLKEINYHDHFWLHCKRDIIHSLDCIDVGPDKN